MPSFILDCRIKLTPFAVPRPPPENIIQVFQSLTPPVNEVDVYESFIIIDTCDAVSASAGVGVLKGPTTSLGVR